MARVVNTSRRFLLGIAFISVLAATGGFFGAVSGVILLLLTRAVLGVAEGIALFLTTGAGVGAGMAVLWGLALVIHRAPTLALRSVTTPRVAPPLSSESN